ncbi:hypothetical protein AM1_0852 [Acaryochloris marina MBIC11017]|uniref:Uncharacterized protein n=1 Tax=Acaryochloris marina (strain MBIC 11017) TaxID=329726 RepID=B0BYL1_ACAM1|nr:hypothetical protein AM1_0852 [Acaryochloris marina MBIC11017]
MQKKLRKADQTQHKKTFNRQLGFPRTLGKELLQTTNQ